MPEFGFCEAVEKGGLQIVEVDGLLVDIEAEVVEFASDGFEIALSLSRTLLR